MPAAFSRSLAASSSASGTLNASAELRKVLTRDHHVDVREFVPQNLQRFGHSRQFVSGQKAHDEAWPRQISDPACSSGRPDSTNKDSLKGIAGPNSPSRSDFLRQQVSASHYCPPVSTPSKQVSRSVARSGADRTLDRDGAAQE